MMGNTIGFKPTFVAYRGSGPAITDMIGGQIDLLWDQVTNGLPQIQSRHAAWHRNYPPQRLAELPNVPTTAELGIPKLDYTMWHGLYVAKGTPRGTVDALNAALKKAVTDPAVVAKFKTLGTVAFPADQLTPEAHAKAFATDLPRIAELVRSSGVKASEAK